MRHCFSNSKVYWYLYVFYLFSSSGISFFNLFQTDSKVQLQELDHTIGTSSDREFWDISFDSEHRLWLLQACETTPVHVFRCSVSTNQLQVIFIFF